MAVNEHYNLLNEILFFAFLSNDKFTARDFQQEGKCETRIKLNAKKITAVERGWKRRNKESVKEGQNGGGVII